MYWYLETLAKYADFRGYATREEFWKFFLTHIIISVAIGVLDGFTMIFGFPLFSCIYFLATATPFLAVIFRRFNDIPHSKTHIYIFCAVFFLIFLFSVLGDVFNKGLYSVGILLSLVLVYEIYTVLNICSYKTERNVFSEKDFSDPKFAEYFDYLQSEELHKEIERAKRDQKNK